MKYIVILSLLALIVLVAGCTQADTTSTVDEEPTTSLLASTVETTIVNTTTTVNKTTTSITLGGECTDDDGGKVYDVKGETTYPRAPTGLTVGRDRCINNMTVNEYYCKEVTGQSYNYEIDSEKYDCPVRCFNGECVEE